MAESLRLCMQSNAYSTGLTTTAGTKFKSDSSGEDFDESEHKIDLEENSELDSLLSTPFSHTNSDKAYNSALGVLCECFEIRTGLKRSCSDN